MDTFNQAIPLNDCHCSCLRLDGRVNDEFRNININFGSDWGSVLVSLGETKVLAQVSCELGIPKATRPNEGMMYINLEAGRNSEVNVQINRTLERTFKDSRCVDLESLCVTAEERVWILRVDLNTLNNDGNLIDCCSIATLCACMHFKHPDVSIVDDEAVIHTAAEKEPIPMVLHHYPVCVSFCTFDDGKIAVADPSAIEERTAESLMNKLVFGLNSFRELCCLNLGGTAYTSSNLLLKCAERAAQRAKYVVDCIKQALEEDGKAREITQDVGFTACLQRNEITSYAEDRLALRLRNFTFKDILKEENTSNEHSSSMEIKEETDDLGPCEASNIVSIGSRSAVLNPSESNVKWVPEEEEEDDDMESDNMTAEDDDSEKCLADNIEHALHDLSQKNENHPKGRKSRAMSTKHSQAYEGSDSEEEEQIKM